MMLYHRNEYFLKWWESLVQQTVYTFDLLSRRIQSI
jgi:hypothetical protein